MNSQREYDEHIAITDARGVQRVDDGRQHQIGARQASDVVHHDSDAFTGMHNLAQGRASDGVFERVLHGASLIRNRFGLTREESVAGHADL